MPDPPKVHFGSKEEYEEYYHKKYCDEKSDIKTFDGIKVHFNKTSFKHAFSESSDRRAASKDIFSSERAERIDWIEAALNDSEADLRIGYDNKKKEYNPNRRVCKTNSNYVVVIQFQKDGTAFFVTAFSADSQNTINGIEKSPKWKGR